MSHLTRMSLSLPRKDAFPTGGNPKNIIIKVMKQVFMELVNRKIKQRKKLTHLKPAFDAIHRPTHSCCRQKPPGSNITIGDKSLSGTLCKDGPIDLIVYDNIIYWYCTSKCIVGEGIAIDSSDSRVVRTSALGAVDLGLIPFRVGSNQRC